MQDRSIGSIKKNAFYHIKCSIINLGDISSPLYFFFFFNVYYVTSSCGLVHG